jgi:2-keto-4-pentenoate hydratase/2-oxohepta-3-ene-1,7-dioic acid hydratase in catechol pathway
MSSHPPDPFKRAHTEAEVVIAVRDGLRDWSPAELAQLPPPCRPGKIRDAEDIANLAYTLTSTRIASNESNDLLVRLETLFAHACRRLSELENGASRGMSSDAQERP